jgi:hypothetical protein
MRESRSSVRLLSILVLCSLIAFAAACAKAGSDDDDDNDDDDVVQIDSGGGNGTDGGGGGCTACDPDTSNGCTDDRCVCNLGPACSGGSTCCALGCRNLDSDPNNCGTCGRPCGPNETCTAGECVCSTTGTDCGALDCCADGCVDTASDTSNCGTCTNTCAGGEVCAGGTCGCGFTCPAPLPIGSKVVCCGDGCYDICSDPTHCGGCDATACSTCSLGGCDDGDPDLLNCFFPPL